MVLNEDLVLAKARAAIENHGGNLVRYWLMVDGAGPQRERVDSYAVAYVERHTGRAGLTLWPDIRMRYASDAVYLLDTGDEVKPYYVAGAHEEHGQLFLYPFPTRGTIPANGGGDPADFATWVVGSTRVYHLKLSAVPPSTDADER